MNPSTAARALAIVLAVAVGCGGGNAWDDDSGPGDGGDGGEGCIDNDGDGYGRGCAAGPDCDDTDPFVHNNCPHCLAGPAEGCACEGDPPVACYEGPAGTIGIGICSAGERRCETGAWTGCLGQVLPAPVEVCNGLDDDCDGEVDEGVAGECGDCDPACVLDSIGAGGESGWGLSDDNSEGVGLDPETGGLILDSARINTYTIWVANSAEGTISKVDVRTFEELGRYAVGPDPSRTSINTLGDAFVALRGGMGITKVSGLGDRCPDTNGDGVITTSSGHDVLPHGQDDCVLWTVPLPGCGVVRGVAAQDVFGPDGEVRSYVWVGGYNGCLWKLDGETGEILVNATPAPTVVYGLALDGHGNLWTSGNGSDLRLGRLDTNRCIDDASCAEAVCSGEGAGDACVKQRIGTPFPVYGITVDPAQRVWMGGGNNPGGGGPCRYDPTLAPGSRWACAGASTFVGGIAADLDGWIWASGTGWATGEPLRAFRVNADTLEWTSISGAEGWSNHGAAVDAEGKVWFINYGHNNATVVVPGPTLHEATVTTNVAPVFNTPYTYSDMTGSQLRFATQPRGHYRALFAGCDEGSTSWGELTFDAFVPARTRVLFRARTAAAPEELGSGEWVVLATVPDDESPVSIHDALLAAGVAPGRYLELQVQLSSERPDSSTLLTPVVYGLAVTHTCEHGLT